MLLTICDVAVIIYTLQVSWLMLREPLNLCTSTRLAQGSPRIHIQESGLQTCICVCYPPLREKRAAQGYSSTNREWEGPLGQGGGQQGHSILSTVGPEEVPVLDSRLWTESKTLTGCKPCARWLPGREITWASISLTPRDSEASCLTTHRTHTLT